MQLILNGLSMRIVLYKGLTMKKLGSIFVAIMFIISGCTQATKSTHNFFSEVEVYNVKTLKEKLSQKKPIASKWTELENKPTTKEKRMQLACSIAIN